ncbi:hypothetical protein ACFQU8_10315 [Lentibacillus kimchii]|uniref:Uncharacterized protein n=1 Tax=Lentibacillus kimchii TaxID=1542911 RepID=A0ABW2UZ33_9BACI
MSIIVFIRRFGMSLKSPWDDLLLKGEYMHQNLIYAPCTYKLHA